MCVLNLNFPALGDKIVTLNTFGSLLDFYPAELERYARIIVCFSIIEPLIFDAFLFYGGTL